ncbi:hypothetical protein GMORB2_0949 [Geosmithia morbida]|uniref:Uncharacterized protein n=1 Tax=Geosmithia morbida TaxID=1094350 RepID=A0A9P5D7E3_9HYPO|nr:uncharacterized protein GMORB2_0949 [Geosmithia morbida]KAF4125705.1 hypothetical protein GMORB2_0949 [Geosmithia morbida]
MATEHDAIELSAESTWRLGDGARPILSTGPSTARSHSSSSLPPYRALSEEDDGLIGGGLPEPDVCFTSVQALIDTIDNLPRDSNGIVVGRVTPGSFDEIRRRRDADSRGWRLSYLADHYLAIMTTTFPANRNPGASQGEGDTGGRPSGPGDGDGDNMWPTIVFETGYSQTLESLRAKMGWWFSTSRNQVKIVVLTKAFPTDEATKRILFEQWRVESARPPRPGATTTRLFNATSGTALQPIRTQLINVVWALPGVLFSDATDAQKRSLDSYSVTRGPLSLSFTFLFLRPPDLPVAGDIIIPDRDLQLCARRVWVG